MIIIIMFNNNLILYKKEKMTYADGYSSER